MLKIVVKQLKNFLVIIFAFIMVAIAINIAIVESGFSRQVIGFYIYTILVAGAAVLITIQVGRLAFARLDKDGYRLKLVELFNKLSRALETRQEKVKLARKDAEEQLGKYNEYLSDVTHDFKAPLHAILNNAELGTEKIENNSEPERVKEYFKKISDGGHRLLSLIDNILDIARMENNAMQFEIANNSMTQCVERVINEIFSIARGRNIDIVFIKEEKDYYGKFDFERLMQVLINIIYNAIKFSPNKSKIIISIADSGREFRKFNVKKGLLVNIQDGGKGVNDSHKEKIFEKFYQAEGETGNDIPGAGLGLAICKKIIEYHKGIIWVEDGESGGSVFKFIIP